MEGARERSGTFFGSVTVVMVTGDGMTGTDVRGAGAGAGGGCVSGADNTVVETTELL